MRQHVTRFDAVMIGFFVGLTVASVVVQIVGAMQ
jgi:hypothetical protein